MKRQGTGEDGDKTGREETRATERWIREWEGGEEGQEGRTRLGMIPNIPSIAPTFHNSVVLLLKVMKRKAGEAKITELVVGFILILIIFVIISSALRGWGTCESQ
eukprot:756758-Hanusia_phi.AAC.12